MSYYFTLVMNESRANSLSRLSDPAECICMKKCTIIVTAVRIFIHLAGVVTRLRHNIRFGPTGYFIIKFNNIPISLSTRPLSMAIDFDVDRGLICPSPFYNLFLRIYELII